MKHLVIIGIYFGFLSLRPIAAQTGKIDALDKLISSLHHQQWFNGAILAGEKGKIIYSKGFGFADFADSTIFNTSTTSDGGSNAKTFTAAGILLLSEIGKLNLQDPVQKYLPAYPYPHTTIFNLITHSTGGLPDYNFYYDKLNDTSALTTMDIIEALNKYSPALPYRPNSNFYYDNVSFDIAAAVIERVTGLTFQQFLEKYFFNPANMNDSFVRPARIDKWMGKRTKGYRIKNDSLKLDDIADREGFYGGSNIWLSATDLYLYGTSFYHDSFLSKKVIEKIISPVSINGKPSAIRLGAWYSGKNADAFYYWGNVSGFYSFVYWDMRHQFTIAFVTNTNTPQWVRPQLTSSLIDIMEGEKPDTIEEPEADIVDKSTYDRITGNYRVPAYGKIEFNFKGSNLYLRLSSGMEYLMIQVDEKTFYVPGLEPWLSFRDLHENKFRELLWNATNLKIVGIRNEESK